MGKDKLGNYWRRNGYKLGSYLWVIYFGDVGYNDIRDGGLGVVFGRVPGKLEVLNVGIMLF